MTGYLIAFANKPMPTFLDAVIELGCCPDFDESGRQLNMVCTCGAKIPITSRYSICEGCLERGRAEDDYEQSIADEEYEDDEDWDDDQG